MIAGRLAFVACFFLATYLGLGGRAWEYGLEISNPVTDFAVAACAVLMVVACSQTFNFAVVLGGVLLAAPIQLLADNFGRIAGWPEAIYSVAAVLIAALLAKRDSAGEGRAGDAIAALMFGVSAKGLAHFIFPGNGSAYSVQFMMTWGMILFGAAQLAGALAQSVAKRRQTT